LGIAVAMVIVLCGVLSISRTPKRTALAESMNSAQGLPAAAGGCSSCSLLQLRSLATARKAGSYLLRRDESDVALTQFLIEAESFPVEIGVQVIWHGGEICRIINIGETDAGVFNPPPAADAAYRLDLHTHPDLRPDQRAGITPEQAVSINRTSLGLPSATDVAALLPSQSAGYVLTRGIVLRYSRGRPASGDAYTAVVDDREGVLARVTDTPDRDLEHVEGIMKALLDRGAKRIFLSYPSGAMITFDRSVTVLKLLQAASKRPR
jgi:hypothetical protein